MNSDFLFFVAFGGVIVYFIYRYLRSGSLLGAMLGGRINREVGEITISSDGLGSQTLTVNEMESDSGERYVAIAFVSKAPLAASMIPIKLSKAQAKGLIHLLQQAVA